MICTLNGSTYQYRNHSFRNGKTQKKKNRRINFGFRHVVRKIITSLCGYKNYEKTRVKIIE